MTTKRQSTMAARAPRGASPAVASPMTAERAAKEIRTLLPDLEAGEEPITHTLLQKLLKAKGIPASARTYWSYVTAGTAIALQIERAQERQRELSQGTPLAQARAAAKQLRARIAELEAANRILVAQQAAMVAYLADDKDGPGLDVAVLHRAQRASLGEAVRGTAFARRPLASFAQMQLGKPRGRR